MSPWKSLLLFEEDTMRAEGHQRESLSLAEIT